MYPRFSISPTTGAVSVLVPLERDGPQGHLLHRLTVTATERGGVGLSAEAVVEIQVEDINDNSPVFARKNYSAVLSGEVVAGTEVITVTATDLDDPDTEDNGRLTYSLGEEQAEFTIEPESGVVRSAVCCLAPGSEYRLEVVATDGGGQTDSAMLHVSVLELAGGQGEFGKLMASRLEVLQAHCRTQDRWPGINSNVMYVLEVGREEEEMEARPCCRRSSWSGARSTRRPRPTGCTTCCTWRAGAGRRWRPPRLATPTSPTTRPGRWRRPCPTPGCWRWRGSRAPPGCSS